MTSTDYMQQGPRKGIRKIEILCEPNGHKIVGRWSAEIDGNRYGSSIITDEPQFSAEWKTVVQLLTDNLFCSLDTVLGRREDGTA